MKERKRKQRKGLSLATSINNTKGMTIIEIMIVLTIIASISGMVGYYVMGALDKANNKQALTEIRNLEGIVNSYYLASSPRKFPETLNQLAEGPSPLTKKVPKDPWGNDYVYTKTGKRKFEIYCLGADGQDGTDDDIKNDE